MLWIQRRKIQTRITVPRRKNSKQFQKAVKKNLTPILEEMKTEPKLASVICDIIFHWRKERPILPVQYPTLFGIRAAFKEQNEGLGWTNFVLGRWSPK